MQRVSCFWLNESANSRCNQVLRWFWCQFDFETQSIHWCVNVIEVSTCDDGCVGAVEVQEVLPVEASPIHGFSESVSELQRLTSVEQSTGNCNVGTMQGTRLTQFCGKVREVTCGTNDLTLVKTFDFVDLRSCCICADNYGIFAGCAVCVH